MLIFDIPETQVVKTVTVAGVKIPLYGDITVEEQIAVEKALVSIDGVASNTEYALTQVSAWLSVRLNTEREAVLSQLKRSRKLIDELWDIYYKERQGDTKSDEIDEIVDEGKEKQIEPLRTLKKNGTKFTSNSHLADLQQNSLVVLDNSVSA